MATYPQGTYIAKPDGFWWSGDTRGSSWNGTLPETVVSVSDVTDNSAVLHWTAVAGATGYLVGRDGADSNGNGPWQTTVAVGTTTQTFTDLLPGTSYMLYCQPQPGGVRKSISITTSTAPVGSGQLPVADVGTTVGSASYAVPTGAIFVATNGSDSGAGTQASPYKTLAHAVSQTSDGDTVVVRGGVYYGEGGDTQNGSATHGIDIYNSITIQNYPGEAVWFDGSQAASSWTASGGLWSAPYDRLFDRSPTGNRGAVDDGGAGWGWVNPSYPCASYPDMVFFDGNQLEQVQTKAEVGPGKFWVEGALTHADPSNDFWFQASKVWIGDDPTGHEVRVSEMVRFLFTHQPNTNIKGIGVRRYSGSCPDVCITVLRNNSLIENVWIEDDANDGVKFAGDTGRDTSNCVMRNCTFRRTGNLASTAYMADNTLYDKVDIQYANYCHYNYAPQAGGIKVSRCQTVIVQNSLFQHIWGKGYWTDMTVDNAQCYNTAFIDTDDKSIKWECGTNQGTLANCLFVGSASYAFTMNDTDRVQVWNCTMVDCGDAAAVWAQDERRPSSYTYNKDPRQPDSYYALSYNQWQINQLSMHNCVITNVSNELFWLWITGRSRNAGDTRSYADFDVSMDGNVYNCRGTAPGSAFALPNTSNGTSYYNTLGELQAASGQDANSSMVTGQAVLDSNHRLTNSTYHSKATALPSDVAAKIGQATGTKYAGAFL